MEQPGVGRRPAHQPSGQPVRRRRDPRNALRGGGRGGREDVGFRGGGGVFDRDARDARRWRRVVQRGRRRRQASTAAHHPEQRSRSVL